MAPDLAVPATGEADLRLELRRSQILNSASGDLFQGVLEISAAGQRIRVPVRAEASGVAGGSNFSSVSPYAGLWVGTAAISHVSVTGLNLAVKEGIDRDDCGGDGSQNCFVAGSEAALRLIVHVDASGNARLLQEVTLLRDPGSDADAVYLCSAGSTNAGLACSTNADCPGTQGACTAWTQDGTPGAEVLVTDPGRLDDFDGVVLAVRAGADSEGVVPSVGRRISTVAFALPDDPDNNDEIDGVPFNGLVNDSSATIYTNDFTLAHNDPLNPFVHPYHPDHDTLDAQSDDPLRAESFAVTRQVRLAFTPTDPEGLDLPGSGATALFGVYGETLTGLHKDALHTGGVFRLHRVSYVAELNPTPSASQ